MLRLSGRQMGMAGEGRARGHTAAVSPQKALEQQHWVVTVATCLWD